MCSESVSEAVGLKEKAFGIGGFARISRPCGPMSSAQVMVVVRLLTRKRTNVSVHRAVDLTATLRL
jgi:hypothetical protein